MTGLYITPEPTTAPGTGTYSNKKNGCTVLVQNDGHCYIAQLVDPSGLPTAHLCTGPDLAPLLDELKCAAQSYGVISNATTATRTEIESVVAVMADAIPHYVGSLTVARFVEDCLACKPSDMSLLDFADHAGSWLICNSDAADCDWPGSVASFCSGYRQASSHATH